MKYKPQLQTKFGDEGNCLSACFTAFFDIGIEDVPVWEGDFFDDWFWKTNKWLADNFNKFIVLVKAKDTEHLETVVSFFQGSAVITSVEGVEDKAYKHAVITRGMNIVFDPMCGEVETKLTIDDDPTFLILSDIC